MTPSNVDLACAIASRRRELQCSKESYGRSRFFTEEFASWMNIPVRLLHRIEAAEVVVPKGLLRDLSAALFPEDPTFLITLTEAEIT